MEYILFVFICFLVFVSYKKVNEVNKLQTDALANKMLYEASAKEVELLKLKVESLENQIHIREISIESKAEHLLSKSRKQRDEVGKIAKAIVPGGHFTIMSCEDELLEDTSNYTVSFTSADNITVKAIVQFDANGNYLHMEKEKPPIKVISTEEAVSEEATKNSAKPKPKKSKSSKKKATPEMIANDFIESHFDEFEKLNQVGLSDNSSIAKIPLSMLPSVEDDFLAALNQALVESYGYLTVTFDDENEQLLAALPL